MPRTAGALVVGAVVALAAACSGTPSAPRTAPAPGSAGPTASATSPTSNRHQQPAVDWPTYHGDNQRSGYADIPPLRGPLHIAWSRNLGAAVYAQPIVVGAVTIVATEHNDVLAVRTATGRVVWHRDLGPPVPLSDLQCGNIDPLGITGTPAYDPATGAVFVVTETTGGRHDLHALDSQTGQQRWVRNLDVGGHDPRAQQQRAALLVANGRVYVAFGGLYGDCGDYVGYVVSVSTQGTGQMTTYRFPTASEAGIWGPPGPVQLRSGRDIFIASGNGAATSGRYDGSDSVIRLNPGLQRQAFFAPSTWAEDNAHDLDLGSSAPVPFDAAQLVVAGKRGTVYLLDDALGGIGGEIAQLDGCAAYGGAAFVGRTIVLPCNSGTRRLDVSGTTMRWRWQLPAVTGSPVIARDLVYLLDQAKGDLIVADLATGQIRTRLHVGAVSRFTTPVPQPGLVLIGTMTGVVAVSPSRPGAA